MYYIHIKSNTIKSNKKRDKNDPPITIRKGRSKVIGYVHSVKILGESTVKYCPNNPLPCGAKVWIETDSEIEIGERL